MSSLFYHYKYYYHYYYYCYCYCYCYYYRNHMRVSSLSFWGLDSLPDPGALNYCMLWSCKPIPT